MDNHQSLLTVYIFSQRLYSLPPKAQKVFSFEKIDWSKNKNWISDIQKDLREQNDFFNVSKEIDNLVESVEKIGLVRFFEEWERGKSSKKCHLN